MSRLRKRDLGNGRFIQDRTIYKIYVYGIGFASILFLSYLGVNTVFNWVMETGKEIMIVNHTSAGELIITEESLEDKIFRIAKEYGISGYQMYRTIDCESKFRNIQSQIIKHGKQELSYGIAQIHLPSWPEVSKQEAMNPSFAIRWMAEHWNQAKWYGYNRKTDKCN